MSWVDNICQKFEAVCQEVDDIVNQNTVKYIENQVQTVGENAMKFYSELVQDLVPRTVDPVRHEAEAVIQQGNAAISSYFKSILGMDEDFADTVDTQSTVEHVAFELVKNHLVHASGGLERINEQDLSVFDESLQEIESKLVGADIATNKNSYSSVKENSVMEPVAARSELSSPDKKAQFEASFFSELANNNHEKDYGALDGVQVAASVDNAMFKTPHTEGTVFIPSASDTVGFSTEAATICDSIAANTGHVSCASASSASAAIAADVASSAMSWKTTIAAMEIEFSSNVMPNEACTISSSASENLGPTTILYPNDEIGFKSDSSISLIDSHGNKAVEIEPVSCSFSRAPSMESYDEDASGAHETAAVIGSSRNGLVQFGSSDNCSCENIDLDKEATNFSQKVKLEESYVIVDCRALHTVSCAAQKLRSYKKKIQDALPSKKRLAKEYEQLAILHGDNAMECCQGSFPAPPTMPLDLRNSQTIQLSDSEWELL